MEPPAQIVLQMQQDLRYLFEQDPEARLLVGIRRHVTDPVKSQDEDGRFRPHPILLLLGVIGGLAAAVFLYFSYMQP
jgi:hypothetical protein